MVRNLGLLLVSCLVGLFLCEAALRLFYPKYAPLAEARYRLDTMRIYARRPNDRAKHARPDTGSMHALHHNNLGLRQHRNFGAADLAAATNVGVFGDSSIENRRLDAPYSLMEPLDYLLNQSGRRFNVLNFGVDGYGTGQSYLHYAHFRYAEDLAAVFYVYCGNDLDDLAETALSHLDEAGRLVQHEAVRSSWWAAGVNRLHLPYLLLDVNAHIEEVKAKVRSRRMTGAEDDEDFRKRLTIFRRLIRRWKRLVEQNGGSSMSYSSRSTFPHFFPAFPTSYRRKPSQRSACMTVLAPMTRRTISSHGVAPPIASRPTTTGMKRATGWLRSVYIGCSRRKCRCVRCPRGRFGQPSAGIMQHSGEKGARCL